MHFHLTQTNRIELSLLIRMGSSVRAAARTLGVSPSTVSRELRRNSKPSGVYHATYARIQAVRRRLAANQRLRKLVGNTATVQYVEAKLRLYWSPEQIAGRMRYEQQLWYVCAQTIYDWVYRFRQDLRVFFRSQKQHYRRTRANTLRKQQREQLLANRRIDQRPASAERRSRYGHWEGDTMVSRVDKARLGTLVERRSGYLLSFGLPNGSSLGFARTAAAALQTVPTRYRRTLTLDNGTEMQDFEYIEHKANTTVYFAYPYHSWERGTNENTNGLLRQYFPKKTSLAVSQAQIDHAVNLLNTRPRKRLNYRTPAEVFKAKW